MARRGFGIGRRPARAAFMALAACLAACTPAQAERTPAPLSLDGVWEFRFEAGKPLEKTAMPRFAADDRMVVPGCWDATPRYFNRRGTGCYRTRFALDEAAPKAFLVVDGMGLRARFWLDGRDLGLSPFAWTRFALPAGALAAGEHELVAAVDNTTDPERVKLFHDYYDFYPFGGFYHGVRLAFDDRRLVVRTRDWRDGTVEVEAEGFARRDFDGTLVFDGTNAVKAAFRGGRARVRVPGFRLWSPEAPNLHRVALKGEPAHLAARFGIRQVATAGRRVTLNGRPIWLKGVNRHESHGATGAATSRAMMYADARLIKEMGCNFVRGSHYAQSGDFLDVCDELGLLVWEESLGWGNWPVHFKDAAFCDLQVEQTRRMVRNSINHPCVVISSFLNEACSNNQGCKDLVDRLLAAIRAEDSGHLTTFACCYGDDLAQAGTDLISFNAYPCWYVRKLKTGSHEEMARNVREYLAETAKAYRARYRQGDERPMIVSEIGVKADYGNRDPFGRSQYSEEFQAEFTGTMLDELAASGAFAGVAIWHFADAKTYTRTDGMLMRAGGYNTGGLFDRYRNPKLAAGAARDAFRRMPAH